jgi:hypothetical protein
MKQLHESLEYLPDFRLAVILFKVCGYLDGMCGVRALPTAIQHETASHIKCVARSTFQAQT